MFNTKPWNSGFPGIPKEVEQDISNLQSRAAALETANNYDDTEIEIGKWIDGKPLYRKIVDFGALPNATTKSVSSGLTNVTIRDIRGCYTSSGSAAPIPNVNITDATYMVELVYLYASNEVRIKSGINLSGATGTVILLYTKNPVTKDGDTEKEPEEVKEPETKTTKKAKKGE